MKHFSFAGSISRITWNCGQ